MIELFLNGGNIANPENEAEIIFGQETICKFILVIAVVAPPWMLLAKPLILK